jgi:hypothetical protein
MIANQIAGFLGVAGAAVATDYESIATVTVGAGGASSVDFNSISSAYTHLQIRYIAKNSSTSAGGADFMVTVNGDTTNTNYYSHYLFGNGATPTAGALQIGGYYGYLGQMATNATGQTSMFSGGVTDILDYKDTNKKKTLRSLLGFDLNGSGRIYLTSNLWNSTSAVTSLSFSSPSGGTFTQYSTFALYGIK